MRATYTPAPGYVGADSFAFEALAPGPRGQIELRRFDGGQKIAAVLSQHASVAA